MKLLTIICIVGLLAGASTANGQQPRISTIDRPTVTTLQPAPPATAPFTPPSLSAPPVTPELWVYSQELRRHDDPAQAVRRKAELKADQRLARLAAMKWYGYSNSRPEASPIPFMGTYSPSWVGNTWNRYEWVEAGGPSLTLLVEGFEVRR